MVHESIRRLFLYLDIDDCINVTCKNGGTCRDSPGSFSCDCVNGYTGPECQITKLSKFIDFQRIVEFSF